MIIFEQSSLDYLARILAIFGYFLSIFPTFLLTAAFAGFDANTIGNSNCKNSINSQNFFVYFLRRLDNLKQIKLSFNLRGTKP